MEPFEAYNMYLALKSHFTSNYDFFKYCGKTNARYDNFLKRKDHYFYVKLSKKKDVKGIVLANLINSSTSDIWIKDILDDPNDSVYYAWKKRIESLTYTFKSDINKLDDDFDCNLKVIDGQHPILLKKYLRNEISIESLIIIDSLTDVFKYWNKNITDTFIWPALYKKCTKYKPFLELDLDKFRKIIIDTFSEK